MPEEEPSRERGCGQPGGPYDPDSTDVRAATLKERDKREDGTGEGSGAGQGSLTRDKAAGYDVPVTMPGPISFHRRLGGLPGESEFILVHYPVREEAFMAITASQARAQLFPLIEKVNNDHVPVEIVSKKGNAVLMSLEDYEALQETAHLLRTPANAAHLLESVAQHRAGKAVARPLAE